MKGNVILSSIVLIVASTSASAFWGFPWGSYDNDYRSAYGDGWGGFGGDQYRGADGSGGADFSFSMSGRMNTDMRGYGSGYGAGDGWSGGRQYYRPYGGYYGYLPYRPSYGGFGAPMLAPAPPMPEAAPE